jgi:hypothetical protein
MTLCLTPFLFWVSSYWTAGQKKQSSLLTDNNGSVAEFVGKGSEDSMFSVIGWRAYSQERGESVTRGDRRQRELEFDSPLPPLARSCE